MNTITKKNILFFSVSTLLMNGCAGKNELEITPIEQVVLVPEAYPSQVFQSQTQPTIRWGKTLALKAKQDDCLDCYATPNNYVKPLLISNNTLNKISPKVSTNYKLDKVINTKSYGAYDYAETGSDTTVRKATDVNKYVAPAVSYVNSSSGSYSTGNTVIQVGAFREYGGAKTYMKRYKTLSSIYNVTIKTGTKNNKPLHRVRIEGFKNKAEAKKFMYSYGIKNAFVVMN